MSYVGSAHLSVRGGCSLEKSRELSTICTSCGFQTRRRSTFVADERQRAVRGGKHTLALNYVGEKLDSRLPIPEVYILDQGCPWRTLVVLPVRRQYYSFSRSGCVYSRGVRYRVPGKCESELCESIEERSSTVLKSVKAPANFVCNSPKRVSHNGIRKLEVRGQHGDLNAVTLPSTGAVSLQLNVVKVIGAGPGAFVILQFCQQSTLLPSSQFWCSSDLVAEPVRLSECINGRSSTTSSGFDVEDSEGPFVSHDSNKETIFVVLGAGSGTGLGTLPRKLNEARTRGTLVVGIFIQPFMFEGPKRLEQANQLIDNLLECTDTLLVVEQDALLRREAVTVSEASSVAKNAVLLSIKAISELLLGKTDMSVSTTVEGSCPTFDDTKKMLQQAGKSWLGSGKGHSFKEAVEKAVSEDPISKNQFPGSNHLVLCTLAASSSHNRDELEAAKSFLHQTLGPELQLIVSMVKNPMLENDVIIATIITWSNTEQGKNSVISDQNGEQHMLLSVISTNTGDTNLDSQQSLCNSVAITSNSSICSSVGDSQEQAVFGSSTHSTGLVPDNGSSTVKQEKSPIGAESDRPSSAQDSPQKAKSWPTSRSLGRTSAVRSYKPQNREELKNVDGRQAPPQTLLGSSASQRSRLALGWEAGPSSEVAEAWAQARAATREPTQINSVLDLSLPVGVRLNDVQFPRTPSDTSAFGTNFEVAEDKWSGTEVVPVDPDALPRNRMMDMGLGAVRDMYNAASALVMGKETTDDSMQATLSQRAASMLETERSHKKLTPLVEMGFKNGIYKGRCQGGLPEGKGRLSFSDGSFYDGQWKQGKRAGSGAFYYGNGDMFQGSWKDDVMHGKKFPSTPDVLGAPLACMLAGQYEELIDQGLVGWMYYHDGDRLYAHFWKGKADGEGRFYSAQGDVFFGQFQDNWRHGEFLYIEASGIRWSELWENGILKSRIPADS